MKFEDVAPSQLGNTTYDDTPMPKGRGRTIRHNKTWFTESNYDRRLADGFKTLED